MWHIFFQFFVWGLKMNWILYIYTQVPVVRSQWTWKNKHSQNSIQFFSVSKERKNKLKWTKLIDIFVCFEWKYQQKWKPSWIMIKKNFAFSISFKFSFYVLSTHFLCQASALRFLLSVIFRIVLDIFIWKIQFVTFLPATRA